MDAEPGGDEWLALAPVVLGPALLGSGITRPGCHHLELKARGPECRFAPLSMGWDPALCTRSSALNSSFRSAIQTRRAEEGAHASIYVFGLCIWSTRWLILAGRRKAYAYMAGGRAS